MIVTIVNGLDEEIWFNLHLIELVRKTYSFEILRLRERNVWCEPLLKMLDTIKSTYEAYMILDCFYY